MNTVPFTDLLSTIVDNRGKTCPTAESGTALIATNCVKNEGLYPTYDAVRWVSDETYATWFRAHPEPGDILFVCKGSPGSVAVVPNPVDFCIAQDMVACRADAERVYPMFLFAALRSPDVQSQIAAMHVGTLIPHFKKGDFGQLRIPLPDRSMQEFIGDLYVELSAKIESNHRLADLTWDLLRHEWQSLEPDDAQRLRLADLVDINPDKVNPGLDQEVIEYIDIASVSPRKASSTLAVWADAPSRARRGVVDGDVIFSTVRPNRRSFALLLDPPTNCVVSTGFAVLRGKDGFGPSAIAAIADDPEFARYLTSVAAGSAYPAVSPRALIAYEIALPPRAVVDSFEEWTMPLRRRAARAENESRTLAELRDTLLPELLAGRLTFAHAETAVTVAS